MLKKDYEKNGIKPDHVSTKSVINLNDDRPIVADHEIGTLIIVILKARNLNDNHFRKQDVYAQATLNGYSPYCSSWIMVLLIAHN